MTEQTIELNMAFMSQPGTSEDGIIISRDVLDKLKFKQYDTRVVEWGSKNFPLNLYGDVNSSLFDFSRFTALRNNS